MTVSIALLIGFSASLAWSQEFVCGWTRDEPEGLVRNAGGGPREVPDQTSHQKAMSKDTKTILLMFSRLATDDMPSLRSNFLVGRNDTKNRSALDFFKEGVPGSFSHYMKEMSGRRLRFNAPRDSDAMVWYTSTLTGVAGCSTTNYGDFARNLLDASSVAYEDYDAIAVVLPESVNCDLGGIAGDYEFEKDGKEYTKDLMVLKRGKFAWMVAVMAHEYGHFMGLPELYDRSTSSLNVVKTRRDAWENHVVDQDPLPFRVEVIIADRKLESAGLGGWSLMSGATGWYLNGMQRPPLAPMIAWSRMYVKWITPMLIDKNATITMQDFSSHHSAYKIPIAGTDQFFLLENRQNMHSERSIGSLYADYDPASGLAIWHVDPMTGHGEGDFNEWEERKGAQGGVVRALVPELP